MRVAIGVLLVLAVAAAIFLVPYKGNMIRSLSIHVAAPEIAGVVEQRARARDWDALFDEAGLELRDADRAQIVSTLTEGSYGSAPNYLRLQIEVDTRSTVLAPAYPRISAACALVEARLNLDADLLGYAQSSPQERQKLLWRIYGAGFDRELRQFLEDNLASENDPETHAFASRILARLRTE